MFSKSQEAAIKDFKVEATQLQLMYLKDKAVRQLCVSWQFISRQTIEIKDKAPKDDNERWLWLWQAVKINLHELAYVTGAKDKCLSALAVARSNRLIYPDGTINKFVSQELTPEKIEIDGQLDIIPTRKKITDTDYKPKVNKNSKGKVGKNKHLKPKDIIKQMPL